MKIDLPNGEWAEAQVPKHLRKSDVVEIVEYAEEHGIDLEGKFNTRAQMGLTDVLLVRYVTEWSLTDEGDGALPITMQTMDDLPIGTYKALASAVAPLLRAMSEATTPDPLSGAGSSTTEPTA